jgi:hypothetical protein
MRICDICKKNAAGYNVTITVSDCGNSEEAELCGPCYRELRHREELARYQAYLETVKTVTGELPRKSRWWHMFNW